MTGSNQSRVQKLFNLSGRVAIVTGGAGLLGYHHADVLAAAGAHVVLLDLPAADPASRAAQLTAAHGVECLGLIADITNESSLAEIRSQTIQKFGTIDILINNAANNPKVEDTKGQTWSRLENFPLDVWDADIRVGLTGAFLCSRVFGAEMAKRDRPGFPRGDEGKFQPGADFASWYGHVLTSPRVIQRRGDLATDEHG